ncbi:MAG TPA: hypothetical protein VJ453_11150, partial [Terriglobales bacterium]|nr:hypothetical protein [Terriglobales bacterium]
MSWREHCRNYLVWCMLGLTVSASAQTNGAVSLEMPKSRSPFSAYTAATTPEPSLANSPGLTQ